MAILIGSTVYMCMYVHICIHVHVCSHVLEMPIKFATYIHVYNYALYRYTYTYAGSAWIDSTAV